MRKGPRMMKLDNAIRITRQPELYIKQIRADSSKWAVLNARGGVISIGPTMDVAKAIALSRAHDEFKAPREWLTSWGLKLSQFESISKTYI